MSAFEAEIILGEIRRKLVAKRRELDQIEEEVRVFGIQTALTVADVTSARAEIGRILRELEKLNDSIT